MTTENPEKKAPTAGSPVYLAVLAGGSGTRFWPASRRLRPKQLLPLGPTWPKSLLRCTLDRLLPLSTSERVLIMTGAHLKKASQADLPELRSAAFLAEPRAKNTAPCIAWASALAELESPDAVLVVVPSDQHIADEPAFLRAVALAIESARSGLITTIGVVPSRPETGFGYIERGEPKQAGIFQVARFVEKPSRERAEEYVTSGRFVWNAGMFVFRARDMLAALERHAPELAAGARRVASLRDREAEYEKAVDEYFDAAPSISIDYAVMEKEKELAVVPAEFGWSDLGSWESSWELAEKDAEGNASTTGAVFIDASNNLVQGSGAAEKKVIALVGVSDLCVVDTGDALLIMPRERSQDVRLVVDALKARGDVDLL